MAAVMWLRKYVRKIY